MDGRASERVAPDGHSDSWRREATPRRGRYLAIRLAAAAANGERPELARARRPLVNRIARRRRRPVCSCARRRGRKAAPTRAKATRTPTQVSGRRAVRDRRQSERASEEEEEEEGDDDGGVKRSGAVRHEWIEARVIQVIRSSESEPRVESRERGEPKRSVWFVKFIGHQTTRGERTQQQLKRQQQQQPQQQRQAGRYSSEPSWSREPFSLAREEEVQPACSLRRRNKQTAPTTTKTIHYTQVLRASFA